MHTFVLRRCWMACAAALWCSLGLSLRAENAVVRPAAAQTADTSTTTRAVDDDTADHDAAPLPPGSDPTPSDGAGPHPAIGSGALVAVIRIEGMIYGFTLDSLERRIRRAQDRDADVIVVELETPGGMVDAALEISNLLKSIPVPTVAWVNDQAYSAGILIASSCNQIVMAQHSVTGDCAPIKMGGSLDRREVKKVLGPLLAAFRDNARTNNFPYVLFQAMCVEGIKVYRVRHNRNDKIQFVNEKDFRFLVHGDSTLDKRDANSSAPANTNADPVLGRAVQTIFAEADRGAWVLDDDDEKPNPMVYDGATFLTVTDTEAIELGLASAIVDNDLELKRYLNAAEVIRISPTWSEGMAGWLTHPAVRSVLMLALVVGAYMEFQSPGLGLPGIVAAVALIALIGSPFLVGLAEVWHAVLFFVGLLLLLVELFVIPGFGILGIAGLLCMLLSLILAIVPASGPGPLPMPGPMMWNKVLNSTIWMLLGLIGSFVALFYLTRYFSNIPFLNRLILATPAPVRDGGSVGGHVPVSGDDAIGSGTIRVGAEGRIVTGLRPIGQAMIDGCTVDVICDGDWIEAGNNIRVTEVRGNRIVVERADQGGSRV